MGEKNEELKPMEDPYRTGGEPQKPEYPTRDEGDEKLVGGIRLPGHPRRPALKAEEVVNEWDDDGHYAGVRRVRREGVEQQIEPIGMALKEQQLAGRQMAAMARTTYEGPGGVRKTIIGPQSMVTFGEGVNFVLGEAHQVLEQLRKEFKAYTMSVEEQFLELGRTLSNMYNEIQELGACRDEERRAKEIWMVAFEAAIKDAKKPGRKNMKTAHQYVLQSTESWNKRHPDEVKEE